MKTAKKHQSILGQQMKKIGIYVIDMRAEGMTEGMICAGGVVNEGVCHVITSRVKKGQN